MLTYLQAVVIGALQGVTELFPVSSLGHSVLVPAVIGGSWRDLVTQSSTASSEASPYLAFIVALHVATAVALLIFFRADWVRIIRGFFATLRPSLAARRLVTTTSTERLAWLIIVATIPVGATGLAFEHTFRTLFAKPVASAAFLTLNGLILGTGELLRRRAAQPVLAEAASRAAAPALGRPGPASGSAAALARTRPIESLSFVDALLVGLAQVLALFSGISRSGVAMVAGLLRGLDHEDAARFSFLLATPVIFAAGVLKLPTLAGAAGAQIHGQVVVGSLVAGSAAYLSVRFLTRYFTTRTLTPFAIYSVLAGVACLVFFTT